jgi:hypothetical protein
MTAPVLTDGRDESSSIAFIISPESTLETLPAPKNPEVTLRRVTSHNVAVISFSGYATAEALEEKTAELLQALHADGIPAKSNPRIALYDPPWIPPDARRNQIMVEVD